MPRLLALEWNENEARVAVAATRGSQTVFEQAFSVSLRSERSGEEEPEADVGGQIATALAARGIVRPDALVSVGRNYVELRRLSGPPTPDAELPHMVRFQALREFHAVEDDWPLDFLPISGSAEEPRTVLAAAMSPRQLEGLQNTCLAAGLKVCRMVLRPCAAASLLNRQAERAGEEPGPAAEVRLLVDVLSNEADLTVMDGKNVVFLRCTRLPDDPLSSQGAVQQLLSEIRRTIAAAQNQLGGRRVQSIVLCGSGEQHAALANQISQDLSTPAELFDPFDGLALAGELAKGLPDHADRFAPLLGTLLDELEQAEHAIDFLHPRRPPEPPSRRNALALAGLAAGLLVLAVIVYGYLRHHQTGQEIARLKAESHALGLMVKRAELKDEAADGSTGPALDWEQLGAELEKMEKAPAAVRAVPRGRPAPAVDWEEIEGEVERMEKVADDVDKWTEFEVVFLDELRWLSESLLEEPKEGEKPEAKLTRVQMSTVPGGGTIKLEGLARDDDAIQHVEDRLQGPPSHRVAGGDKREDDSDRDYNIWFDASVFVYPEKK